MSKRKSTATRRRESTAAAERAAAIRREQQAKERRRRAIIVGAVGAAVIALVVGIGIAVQSSRDTTGEKAVAPNGADGYALTVGTGGPTVTVYEDFMCPYCGQFEAASRQWLQRAVADGDVTVEYHVVSILDRYSSTGYSTRAANAWAAVLDTSGPGVATAFHDLLYENQPEEGSAGLTDDQLVQMAVEAGAEEQAVRPDVENGTYDQWVKNSTNAFSQAGYNGTPTVLLDGEQVPGPTMRNISENLKAQVLG